MLISSGCHHHRLLGMGLGSNAGYKLRNKGVPQYPPVCLMVITRVMMGRNGHYAASQGSVSELQVTLSFRLLAHP